MDGVDTDVGIDAMSMHDDVAVLDDVLDDLDPVGPLLDMFDASTNDGSARFAIRDFRIGHSDV